MMVVDQRAAEDSQRRRDACLRAFQTAMTARTVAAFDDFLANNADCSEYQTALIMRDTLSEGEACSDGYRAAQLENSEDAWTAYLRDNPACPQAEAARSQLESLRNAAVVPQTGQTGQTTGQGGAVVAPQVAPAPVQVQPARPSCDELWYQRNAIYDAAGYCFSTARAQAVFDNAGCTGGTPSASAMQEVQRIIRLEEQYGCR